MRKKTRNTLSDLLEEVDVNNLKEPEIEPKQVKSTPSKKQAEPQKNTTKTKPSSQTILDIIKEEEPSKRTRITLDLDEETYASLKQLAQYAGKTQAKLLRALIKETAKLLQNKQ
jgi:Ribbon-helix-helix protein, copG family